MLEAAIYFLLKKHFRQESYYVHLLELFHEVRTFEDGTLFQSLIATYRLHFKLSWVNSLTSLLHLKTMLTSASFRWKSGSSCFQDIDCLTHSLPLIADIISSSCTRLRSTPFICQLRSRCEWLV